MYSGAQSQLISEWQYPFHAKINNSFFRPGAGRHPAARTASLAQAPILSNLFQKLQARLRKF